MSKAKLSTTTRNGWTPERRKTQSQAIHRWKPWAQSTGAKTKEGKAIVARNAYKGGIWAELRLLRFETNTLKKKQKEMLEKLKE